MLTLCLMFLLTMPVFWTGVSSFWPYGVPNFMGLFPMSLSFLASYFYMVFWCSYSEALNSANMLNYLYLIISDAVFAHDAKSLLGILWFSSILSRKSDLFWISDIASFISTVNCCTLASVPPLAKRSWEFLSFWMVANLRWQDQVSSILS